MDGEKVRAVAEAGALARGDATAPPADAGLTFVGRAQDEVGRVRKNVRDAAAAVLAWLAAVVAHDEAGGDLDDVLDRCLRPGPDVSRLNYTALAKEIHRVTGVELSPRRVQTAIGQLRTVRGNGSRRGPVADEVAPPAGLAERLGRLRTALAGCPAPTPGASGAVGDRADARALGTEVLTAVRAAAGRVIDRDFGEGIPADGMAVTRDLEHRFLTYVRDGVRRRAAETEPEAADRAADVAALLGTLSRAVRQAEASGRPDAETDVRLVMHGAKVVVSLLGGDSLPGLMAQLNVLVAGRALIHTELYVAEMLRLADAADALHDDAETGRYLTWVRRLPEDRRVPSARRVASYCRSNAATRIYDRLFDGTLAAEQPALADMTRPPRTWRALADATHDLMRERDGGCTLTLTGLLVRHTVGATLDGDAAAVREHLRSLGEDKALDRLEALVKFENNDALVRAARGHAVAVYPALATRLIVAG